MRESANSLTATMNQHGLSETREHTWEQSRAGTDNETQVGGMTRGTRGTKGRLQNKTGSARQEETPSFSVGSETFVQKEPFKGWGEQDLKIIIIFLKTETRDVTKTRGGIFKMRRTCQN